MKVEVHLSATAMSVLDSSFSEHLSCARHFVSGACVDSRSMSIDRRGVDLVQKTKDTNLLHSGLITMMQRCFFDVSSGFSSE